MDVSVIIVNYNVEHFLAQCLLSVNGAVEALEREGAMAEVFVVDNKSVDGSCAMVRERFPWVQLIALDENVGFSAGNNVAIKEATGRWVLLLNPDTVVGEETFVKALKYADERPQLGGLGVPMVDGQGRFLPESKRGVPTPGTALFKITGLYRLAPRSGRWNRYYMGAVDRNESAPIEILSGAFMWLRRAALDDVGLLDEAYFMYGEDIDLSWRLIQGGWENHYFADTSIVHYKGESTKKGSLNYVLVFYRAMLIFAQTHFAGRQARVLTWMIRCAIYVRAAMAIVARMGKRWGQVVLDAVVVFSGLAALLVSYAEWTGNRYSLRLAGLAFAGYTAVWLASVALSRGYHRPVRLGRVFSGVIWGTMVLLVVYALLPESLRFSRALILFGTVWTMMGLTATRFVLGGRGLVRGIFKRPERRRIIVAGPTELARIHALVQPASTSGDASSDDVPQAVRPVGIASDGPLAPPFIAEARDLQEAIRVHNIQEVILSGLDLTSSQIIELMQQVADPRVEFRIAWSSAEPLIGSGGPEPDPLSDLQRGIHRPDARRAKRLFDVTVATLFLLGAPILALAGRGGWIRAAGVVISGSKSWVGYSGPARGLPSIRPGILPRTEAIGLERKEKMDRVYARDYRWTIDFNLVREALLLHRVIEEHGND